MSPLFRQRLFAVLWAAVLFVGCLALYQRHNSFPYYYHPDEPGKVEQIRTGVWNFNHPMLLLSATRAWVSVRGGNLSDQAIVESGRQVSAVFTALTVVALSGLAYLWRGWSAALIAGVVLGVHHQFYELAHYMKEDSALLLGVALTVLVSALYWQKPSRKWAALLGIACGLAISGKYIGVVTLALALPVLWRQHPEGGRWQVLGFFTGAVLLTCALVNLPLLVNLTTFESSLSREMDFVVQGQRGMTRSVPHSEYWSVFLDNSTPAIWLLLLVYLAARWNKRDLALPEALMLIFPFAYTIALSFSPKSNDRYFFPATALITTMAVLGIEDTAWLLYGKVSRRAVTMIAALVLIGLQLAGWGPKREGLLQYDAAYQNDDLQELIAWINAELPASAIIARDNRVGLPDPKRKKNASRMGVIPQQVLASKYVADLGTVDELRAKGVTYVIVSRSDYGRFFLQNLRPQKAEAASFAQRKSFYEDLFRRGELKWERERGTVIYLHPGLQVYRIQEDP